MAAARATGRRRIWARVRSWNAASIRVLDRLEFEPAGRLGVDEYGLLWYVRRLRPSGAAGRDARPRVAGSGGRRDDRTVTTARRVPPGPGQESVWDYPRPPRLERSGRQLLVRLGGEVVAATSRAWRVLETSHPPVYYVPREDVRPDALVPSPRRSWCEFKGEATYWTVVGGAVTRADAAWSYPRPAAGYEPMAGAVAFYPALMEHCRLDGELVRPQPGGFYGGWITDDVVGPFKGEPGTAGW